jgi:DNA-binding response OmpR family regulator
MSETSAVVLFGMSDLEATASTREILRGQGHEVFASSSSREILEVARRRAPAVIVLDDRLDAVGGQVLIGLLRDSCPEARIILVLPPGCHPDHELNQPLVCTLASPVSEQELSVVIFAALRDHRPARAAAAPPVIFCVDDDALFLKSLVRILRRRGYSVVGFDSPEKVLEGIPIHKPSLVFIDVLMPGMNGLDLASELREEYGDSLPLVLLSARNSDEEIAEGYRTGARYYITKPCEPDRVINIADYLLRDLGPRERELIGSKL